MSILKSGRPSSTKQHSIEAVQELDNDTPLENSKRLNADIPESLHFKIKMQALTEGLDMRTLIIKMAENYLNNKS